MNNNSSDSSLIRPGDIIEIDLPARYRFDGKNKPKVKYCFPLFNASNSTINEQIDYENDDNETSHYYNFDTTNVILTTSQEVTQKITTGVFIPENEYDFLPEGTYVICSQSYTLPNEIIRDGTKIGSVSDEHFEEIKIAVAESNGLLS